ncbi:MAG: hypothetical protein JW705_02555, partial [Methanosarcinaceae archaeon]|nr:hypothetical protein [Methanosarcinaceae archaeon]
NNINIHHYVRIMYGEIMEKLEKHIRLSYSLAFMLIMAGVILIVMSEEYQQAGIILANIGAIILFVIFIKAKRYRSGPVKDERSIKIGAYGLSYSWFVTFVLISLLFWVEESGSVKMTVEQVLAILMFTMVLTAKGIQWYLFRKGDV